MLSGCSSSSDGGGADSLVGLWELSLKSFDDESADTILIAIAQDESVTLYTRATLSDVRDSCYWRSPSDTYFHESAGKFVYGEHQGSGVFVYSDDYINAGGNTKLELSFELQDNSMVIRRYGFGSYWGKKARFDESSLILCDDHNSGTDVHPDSATPISSLSEIINVWDTGYNSEGLRTSSESYVEINSNREITFYFYHAKDEGYLPGDCYSKQVTYLEYIFEGRIVIDWDGEETERHIVSLDQAGNMLYEGSLRGTPTSLIDLDLTPRV